MKKTRLYGWAGMAALALFLAIPGAGSASPVRGAPPARFVSLVELTGTVDPLSAHYVRRSIAHASTANAAAVVLRIDTPGGLDSSMREIIRSIQGSDVPVLCWVGPPGARAASAGTFILIGCPFAAMAPGTNVGAAHPVGITGDVLSEKVTNDAAAYIRSLAELRGRNAAWAEKAVRQSVSISAQEALRLQVIDLVVPSIPELLRQTNGITVQVKGGRQATVEAEGAPLDTARMSAGESIFHSLIDPNFAFLLFVFGIAGLVYEVLHPGLNVAGFVGLVALVASFVILGMLPVNVAGLILIVAAIGFFIVDLKVAGHGLPTVAGITCLVLGGLFLFDASVPKAHVSRGLVIGVALALALFFATAVRAAMKARHLGPSAGVEIVVGATGRVTTALDPVGVVHANSEHWTARSRSGNLAAGTKVRVVDIKGLTLEVEPVEAGSEPQPTGEGVR
jgi:membrane-bound serine protease (ClpP class)